MQIARHKKYLFVYGTLMSAFKGNLIHQEMNKYCSFFSKGFIFGKLYLIDNYPGFIITNTTDKVFGELYEIEDEKQLFKLLDEYEDYSYNDELNSMYIRNEIKVYTTPIKKTISAWVYIFNKPIQNYHYIVSGNFLEIK